MGNTTNLDAVKLVAETLLQVEVGDTEMSPLVVTHPFTSSGMVAFRSDEGFEMLDILNNKEDLERWQEYVRGEIYKSDSAYHIYLMLNKPYALTFLKYAQSYLSDEDFASILASAWTGSENPHSDANVRKQELLSMFRVAKRELLMEGDEYKVFTGLPDTITVYRGVTDFNAKNYLGLAWSTELRVAEWFAGRFGEHGFVYRATVDRAHVLACFTRRNEAEVVVDPHFLKGVKKYREVSKKQKLDTK